MPATNQIRFAMRHQMEQCLSAAFSLEKQEFFSENFFFVFLAFFFSNLFRGLFELSRHFERTIFCGVSIGI